MFWTIYFIGVIISIIFISCIVYYEEKNKITKHSVSDYFGLLLFGLLWPCFVIQIIARILDIIVG